MPEPTNFPNGVASWGSPVLGFGQFIPTGKVLWVHGTLGINDGGRGSSPSNPMRSIHYASTQCRAGKGDVILVMPGHTESVTAAGGLTLGVSGVTVIGLGSGAQKPAIGISTVVGANIAVTAASVTIVNCNINAIGIDAITSAILVTAADFKIFDCTILMGFDSSAQAVAGITLSTGTARCVIERNLFYATFAGSTAGITSSVAGDQHIIRNNRFNGIFSTAAVVNATNAWTNLLIEDNRFHDQTPTTGVPAIVLPAGATGFIINNKIASAGALSAGGGMTAAGCFKFDNKVTDSAAGSGVLDPAAVTL